MNICSPAWRFTWWAFLQCTSMLSSLWCQITHLGTTSAVIGVKKKWQPGCRSLPKGATEVLSEWFSFQDHTLQKGPSLSLEGYCSSYGGVTGWHSPSTSGVALQSRLILVTLRCGYRAMNMKRSEQDTFWGESPLLISHCVVVGQSKGALVILTLNLNTIKNNFKKYLPGSTLESKVFWMVSDMTNIVNM